MTRDGTHPASTPDFWEHAYREQRDGWDMGTPTPVFVELLAGITGDETEDRDVPGDAASLLPPPPVDVFIPCSGRGYDALLFARHGYRVTAVDFAREAAEHLSRAAADERLDIDVLSDDMFTMRSTHSARFDMLIEYTCLCAIDPARRREYVDLCADLLRSGGVFVGLIFPVDGRPGGPPWSIDTEELKADMRRHFSLRRDVTPISSVKPRYGKERLMIWEKSG